mmetsp:Transcript_16731/g.28059  ORF Transcript_16731/g.28059 Transcript_16731/m.28059 type:complete len:182 (-) Transcript_16731:204-749(-)
MKSKVKALGVPFDFFPSSLTVLPSEEIGTKAELFSSLGVVRFSNSPWRCKISSLVTRSGDPTSAKVFKGANHHSISKSFNNLAAFVRVTLSEAPSAKLFATNRTSSTWNCSMVGVGVFRGITNHEGGTLREKRAALSTYGAGALSATDTEGASTATRVDNNALFAFDFESWVLSIGDLGAM